MIHLDRLISTFNPSVSFAYDGNTTWTLPFDVPTDLSEGTLVLVSGDEAVAPLGTILTSVRNAEDSITYEGANLSIFEMFVGVLYEMSVELSTLFPHDRQGGADTRGKLQLRYLELEVSQTDAVTVTVAQPERTDIAYVASDIELDKGAIRVPLQGSNLHTAVTIASLSPLGCRLEGFDWEGYLHVRNYPR